MIFYFFFLTKFWNLLLQHGKRGMPAFGLLCMHSLMSCAYDLAARSIRKLFETCFVSNYSFLSKIDALQLFGTDTKCCKVSCLLCEAPAQS